MISEEIEIPFDSIESAQDFMNVLADTILEAVKDLNRQHQHSVTNGQERRAQAIELAIFKAKVLSCHVHKSRIALNDLRTLRRLILNERLTAEKAMAAV
ncbi:MAG TPA: hypothetical protein VGH38_38685 [Bryobacteraceae bacterium]|jgi:hypothetical protein